MSTLRTTATLCGVERTDHASLYAEIGENIRRAREGHLPRLSQRALGLRVGLSRASLANIEGGRHRIQIHVLYAIARELGVAPADLLPAHRGSGLPSSFTGNLNPAELAAVTAMLSAKRDRS